MSFIDNEISRASLASNGTAQSNVADDEEDEHIRALAASLAPAVEELDALLASPGQELSAHLERIRMREPTPRKLEFIPEDDGTNNDYDSEYGSDDDFDREMQNLEASQQLLREELEFAHNFGAMMNTPDKQNRLGYDPPASEAVRSSLLDATISFVEESGEESGDLEEETVASEEPAEKEEEPIKAAPLDPEEKQDKIGDDAVLVTAEEIPVPPPKNSKRKSSVTRHNYTLSDHSHSLELQKEARGGWYYMPLNDLNPTAREYILPLPEKELDRLYAGLQPALDEGRSNNNQNDRLPLRTICMQLRPDVLVGAVMDALMHALQDICDVQKRQGGHLVLLTTRPVSPNAFLDTFMEPEEAIFTNSKQDEDEEAPFTPLELDFQVCTYKGGAAQSRFCERTLLMRIYYPSSDDDEGPIVQKPPQYDDSILLNWKLKETAALVQKLETSKQASSETFFSKSFWGKKPVYPNKQAMQEAIAQQLLEKYKPCPSVATGHLTLSSLSKADWPWVQYAYQFISAAWEELHDRDLTHASLNVNPFGQFPALTTLDVHYCSQLRRLSRENMVLSLLRSASELEQYAREAEYACASLIQVLKPCFEMYGLDPPSLPQPLPLTAYPLDYKPHQDVCPPWGMKVMEAMNEVTAISSDSSGDHSYQRAEKAVDLVLNAFQRQHDEEQSARLGRKNLQVMDRLSKMQAHKQVSIEMLSQAYAKSRGAKKAADEFHKFSLKAKSDMPQSEQVPLFKCSILAGSYTGSVYVTATQLMCVTQFIPIVGGNKVLLLDLAGLDFVVQEASTSLLNPLPAGISVRRAGEEAILFRPSYAAPRLKVFLEIIQALGKQNSEHLMGDAAEGVVTHMYGDVAADEKEEDTKE